MQLHVAALFTHDATGHLLRINEPGGGIAPRFLVGLTADGPVLRFRGDIDEPTRVELERAAAPLEPGASAANQPIDPEPFRSILARHAPIEKIWQGPAYAFPDGLAPAADAVRITEQNAECLRPLLHAWSGDVLLCQPMLALVIDEQAVAICASVRRTDHAHEAGVETAVSHRGRGFATIVVAAWARAVREDGLLPLYSTSWEMVASQNVARKLGLVRFGSDLHIT